MREIDPFQTYQNNIDNKSDSEAQNHRRHEADQGKESLQRDVKVHDDEGCDYQKYNTFQNCLTILISYFQLTNNIDHYLL